MPSGLFGFAMEAKKSGRRGHGGLSATTRYVKCRVRVRVRGAGCEGSSCVKEELAALHQVCWQQGWVWVSSGVGAGCGDGSCMGVGARDAAPGDNDTNSR